MKIYKNIMPPKERKIWLIYLLGFLTFGIYFIYWFYVTSKELQELGADIPSFILFLLPVANLYWVYRYIEEWARITGKDNPILYFLVFLFFNIAIPFLVQKELNNIARNYSSRQAMMQRQQYMPPTQYPNQYYGGTGGYYQQYPPGGPYMR